MTIDAILRAATYAAGGFAVILGLLHFTFPRRFGYASVIASTGPPPPPFRLGPYVKDVSRADLLGIVYVMNHAASVTILSIGVFDLAAGWWWGTPAGRIASAWAALFWWARSLTQLHLGWRRGDRLVFAWFGILVAVQALAAVAS
jgi:hypothetical protein